AQFRGGVRTKSGDEPGPSLRTWVSQALRIELLRRTQGIDPRIVRIARRDDHRRTVRELGKQQSKQQIVGEMIDGEGRLEPCLVPSIDVAELGPCMEDEHIDSGRAECFCYRLSECPYASQPTQIERPRLNWPRVGGTCAEQQPRVRRRDDVLRGDLPQAGCATCHDHGLHMKLPSPIMYKF